MWQIVKNIKPQVKKAIPWCVRKDEVLYTGKKTVLAHWFDCYSALYKGKVKLRGNETALRDYVDNELMVNPEGTNFALNGEITEAEVMAAQK